MDPRRWTPLTYLAPRRYIERDPAWAEFDLHEWAREDYDWLSDPWNGFRDLAKRPSETVADAEGDCEDFALVAATWAVANDRQDIGLGFCWEAYRPWPTHVVAYDAERVYSSGRIRSTSLDDWLEDSRYAFALRRRVG